MATHVITQMDRPRDADADRLTRQRIEHARRVDPTDKYLVDMVSVEYGPKHTKTDINVKWAENGSYVFATIADNPEWGRSARDEWQNVAKDALEKFCAFRNLQIVFGPRPEDTNRYNLMAEVRGTIA